MSLWATKSIATLRAEAEAAEGTTLKRALGPFNLVTLGIGAVIGAGIFVLTGQAAALYAGPAVPISMAIVGVACAFAGLCYAEMASTVPVAGSAYTYVYATLGEFLAWIVGWDLVLEYAAGAAGVSVGWSANLVALLGLFGVHLPGALAASPTAWCTAAQVGTMAAPQCAHTGLNFTGAVINLPAVCIVALMSTVLVVGIRESARFTNAIVVLKVAIVLLVAVVGLSHLTPANWKPFIAPNAGEWGTYGWSGVLRGAGLVFFAYIGFDAVSTTAQEAKNPQRDMPIGILGSLVICTVLYILVSGIATGVTPYQTLDVPDPIATAADHAQLGWLARLIKLGAIAGLSSVILVMMLGQTRVFWTMSRDGLLPPFVSDVHPRFKTPWVITIVTGVVVSIFGGILPVGDAGDLCNIGTLLAFVIVSIGVLVLRVREPNLPRRFKTPLVWVVAPLGALSSFGLMLFLPLETWIRL